MGNKLACATLALAAAAPLQAHAALEYFLKIPGAAGESADSKHKSEIDVMSWAWGVSNTGAGSVFEPFTWEQGLDASFVPLFLGLVNNTPFPSAVLSVRNSGMAVTDFFRMTLSDVHMASLSSQGTDAITVHAAARYGAIAMHYCKQKPDGSLASCYDGSFTLNGNGAVFSGDATVLEGLVKAGGTLKFVNSVPEPATSALLTGGILALGALARRRKASSSAQHDGPP
jgi:type VI secretion system secreted protein Hcp